MSDCKIYVFFEKDKILAVFDNFLDFRKKSFHYILDKLVMGKHFPSKIKAGRELRISFLNLYNKNKNNTLLTYKDFTWGCQKFNINSFSTETQIPVIEKKDYVSEFTKIFPKKKATSYKALESKISYLELESLYGK